MKQNNKRPIEESVTLMNGFNGNASVTIKDVARQADVSIGTVSRVFNNHSNVSQEIRQRVLQAAQEVGYSRSTAWEAQHTQRAIKEVGFLYCMDVDTRAFKTNPFWSVILDGVEGEARKHQIKIMYRMLNEPVYNPALLFPLIQEMKVGGILLVGPAEKETIVSCKRLNLPLVLVDNYVNGLSVDSVLCDNFEGARTAVDYLIEQGHRQIAFIGAATHPTQRRYTIERRAVGYRTALLDAGLPLDTSLIETSNLCPEDGYDACNRLLERKATFSAIFCANDEVALGAMKAILKAGLRIPEDISLIGFDDIALIEHLTPALTTVRVNKEALGTLAVRSLLTRAAYPDMIGISSILDVELIKRESVSRRVP